MIVKQSPADPVIESVDSDVAALVTANQIMAGPSSGNPTLPVFRTLLASDLPSGSGASGSPAWLPNIWHNRVDGNGTQFADALACLPFTGSVAATPQGANASQPQRTRYATTNTANSGFVVNEAATALRTIGSMKVFRCSFQFVQITNIACWIGYCDVPNQASCVTAFKNTATPAANFVGFRFSTLAGDATWQCVTQTDASHQTVNASTGPNNVNTTEIHVYEIQYDGTNILFFIDGLKVGSQSGNLPSASLAMIPFVEVDNVNTANNRQLDIVFFQGIVTG